MLLIGSLDRANGFVNTGNSRTSNVAQRAPLVEDDEVENLRLHKHLVLVVYSLHHEVMKEATAPWEIAMLQFYFSHEERITTLIVQFGTASSRY